MKCLFDFFCRSAGSGGAGCATFGHDLAGATKLCSPVLFAQVRLGLRGKPFRMVEFCTMTDAVVQGRTCLLVSCGDVGELARIKERLRDGQETLVTWGELPNAG